MVRNFPLSLKAARHSGLEDASRGDVRGDDYGGGGFCVLADGKVEQSYFSFLKTIQDLSGKVPATSETTFISFRGFEEIDRNDN